MNGRTKARPWNIVQGKASVNAKVGYRGLLSTVAEIVGENEAKGISGIATPDEACEVRRTSHIATT